MLKPVEEGKNCLKNRKFLRLFMMKLMRKFFKITKNSLEEIHKGVQRK